MFKVFPDSRKQAPSKSIKALADDVEFILKLKGTKTITKEDIRDAIQSTLREHGLWGKGFNPQPLISQIRHELSCRGGKAAGRISHQRALARKAYAKSQDPQMWLNLGDTKPVQMSFL